MAIQKNIMKTSEVYEKYYKIKLPNGEIVSPNLRDEDREVMDMADELNVPPYERVFTRRGGYTYGVNPVIIEAINKKKNL